MSLLLSVGGKIQRNRIHTKPLKSWRRPIIKNMPQMRVAPATEHFCTVHAMRVINLIYNRSNPYRLIKTWPAAGTRKLGVRFKKLVAANGTVISTLGIVLPVLARKRLFRGFFPGNLVQLPWQNQFPSRIANL